MNIKDRKNKQIELIREFKKIHNNKYNYSLFEYSGVRNKIEIICPTHGEFKQYIQKHLQYGCKKCAVDRSRIGNSDFIKRSVDKHGEVYDYSLVNYVQNKKKVIIICKTHGQFLQHPAHHLNGSGCKKCSRKFGIMEGEWLDHYNINSKNRQVKIHGYIVDGFDPITNTIYEFNGDFWHGNPSVYNKNDINAVSGKTFGYLYRKTIEKENHLIDNGYNIVSIWESEFTKGLIEINT